jgi:hypothetical protein
VRLFSTKSFKALGTLIYHKPAVQALVFARAYPAVARPHHHRHHHHPRDPAKSAKSGAGGSIGSIGNVGVPNTYILSDIRDPGRSGDDDDGGDAGADVDAVDHDDDDKIAADNDANDEDDDMSAEEKARRSRWLVSGDKDGRVVVWALMGFTSEGHQKERAP